MLGLFSDLPRNTRRTIAEWGAETTPVGMQHLLGRAERDADQVREDVRGYLVELLHNGRAVLVVDETGDVRKGTATVGVPHHCAGAAGPSENAPVAVHLVCAGQLRHAAVNRELYVPRSWTACPDRCRTAGPGRSGPEEHPRHHEGIGTEPKPGRTLAVCQLESYGFQSDGSRN